MKLNCFIQIKYAYFAHFEIKIILSAHLLKSYILKNKKLSIFNYK